MEQLLILEAISLWCLLFLNLEELFSTNSSAEALPLSLLGQVAWKTQYLNMIRKVKKGTDLILCLTMWKISSDAWGERFPVLETNKRIKN
jgi:hypothetical protein